MANYLLEVRTEEIPARFMKAALAELEMRTKKYLDKDGIPYGSFKMMGTPRRLAMAIFDMAIATDPVAVESKGPNVKAAYDEKGEPTKALLGFCRGQGITPEEVSTKLIKGVEYIYLEKTVPGVNTNTLLPGIIEKVLKEMHFPKMMHWGNEATAFVRPVRSIISLFDNEEMPVTFAGVKSSNKTVGHRFLSEGMVTINREDTYVDTLRDHYVICDIDERRNLILAGIAKEEINFNGQYVPSGDLLEEVLFLVEYPTVFTGSFKKEYLLLPKEVVMITMAKHQKYFPLEAADGKLLPNFIGVRCGNCDAIETVIKGNEKVLVARLEDARFFYEEDQKTPLLSLREKLDRVVFQEQLGTIGNKIDRIATVSAFVGQTLDFKCDGAIEETALLCKCDLETQMVYEFPELQGKMGRYYAEIEGYDPLVSTGIEEHYKPVFAADSVAKTQTGIAVALADKMDTIIGMIGIGLMPTGSQDPYALRRHALGIVRTLIENKLHFSLEELILASKKAYGSVVDAIDLKAVKDFFKLRLKVILEKELSYDLVDSLLKGDTDDVYSTYLKALDLKTFSQKEAFKDLVEVLKRAKNIVKKQESVPVVFDNKLLVENAEVILGKKVSDLEAVFNDAIFKKDYLKAMELFVGLKGELADFFESVMVIAEDEAIKNNRLGLLGAILIMGDQLFDVESVVI